MAGNYEFITKSFMIYCNKFMSKMILPANSQTRHHEKSRPGFRSGLYFEIIKLITLGLRRSTFRQRMYDYHLS
jgi:hypothetical protein